MTKNEFLSKLELELKKHNIQDREDLVSYYEDIIDGKIERGMSETEALQNFHDVDSLIKEILLETTPEKPFTYSDYINESPSKTATNGHVIMPAKENGIYSVKTQINDKSNLSVNVWDRKIDITSSSEVDMLHVNYHKRLFNPVKVISNGNDIKISETKGSFWLAALVRILFFVIVFLASAVILEYFVAKTVWWHYLILGAIASSIVNLSSLFIYLSTRNKKNIEIIVPRNFKLHSLNTIVKSGKIRIDKIVAHSMSIKIVSGKVMLLDFHADELEIRVSSGSAIIGEQGFTLSQKINRLILNTSSGSTKLYGVSVATLNSKTSSGSLKLYDSKFDKVSIKCSSGSIKGDNLTLLENDIVVSSGSVKLNNLVLGTSNLRVSSGTIKLKEIKDSKENFMISGKVSSGSIKINHEKMDFLGYKLVKDLPQKSIVARVSSGTIHLNFNKDQ